MGANIPHDSGTDVGPDIKHGHEKPAHGQRRIGSRLPDLLHDSDKFSKSFQRIVFTLDGNEDFISSSQRIGHEDPKGGRAIHDDELELSGVLHRLEDAA